MLTLCTIGALWSVWGWHCWPRVETFPSPDKVEVAAFLPVFAPVPHVPSQKEIQKAMDEPVVGLSKTRPLSPRGDARDYVSLSIYWWPNPLTGIPWMPRDGRRNPMVADYDAPRLRCFTSTVYTLAALGSAEADARALAWLDQWLIDPETAMHPHLTFAQMMPGIAAGGRQGIIEGLPLCTELLDALAWMDARHAFSQEQHKTLRDWFYRYGIWLRRSAPGRAEHARPNNHGTWHDVQVTAIAVALGENLLARQTLTHSCRRLSTQFAADGSQPEEVRRAESFNYSIYNLDAWLRLASLDHKLNEQRLSSLTAEGAIIERGLSYLEQNLPNWRHPHLTPPSPAVLLRLRKAWKMAKSIN